MWIKIPSVLQALVILDDDNDILLYFSFFERKKNQFTTMQTILVLSVVVLLLSIRLYQSSTEHFDLSAAFIDLATYDEPEKYMYGN